MINPDLAEKPAEETLDVVENSVVVEPEPSKKGKGKGKGKEKEKDEKDKDDEKVCQANAFSTSVFHD